MIPVELPSIEQVGERTTIPERMSRADFEHRSAGQLRPDHAVVYTAVLPTRAMGTTTMPASSTL
jgi:hypothetical protein